jgi:hypothetical protein
VLNSWQQLELKGLNAKLIISGADVPAPSEAVLEIGEVTSKLYLFSMEENGPVVIPNHLKVPEADFKVGSVTSYQSMETQQSVTVVESIPVDAPVEEPDKYRYNLWVAFPAEISRV